MSGVGDSGESRRVTVLFICAGNTCRSPMAAALLSRLLGIRFGRQAGIFVVQSAGIGGRSNAPATNEAVKTLERRGIDLVGHRSKRLSKDLVSEADLILTMTGGQREAIVDLVGAADGKTFTLKEFVAACELHQRSKGSGRGAGDLRGRIRLAIAEGTSRARQVRSLGDAIGEIGGELAGALKASEGLDRSHLGSFDIVDPFGGGAADYERCAQEIEELIERLVECLLDAVDETGRGVISGEAAP